MTSQLQTILSELKARLTELYGERLEKLVLFGSQARGDAEPDSDIDVLVVLKGSVDVGRELWRISEATSELSLKYSTVLSSVVMSAAQYRGRTSGFLSAVQREGRTI
jgi:predicted nucleotidyltransferase